jgi:molybdate transport system permease protein
VFSDVAAALELSLLVASVSILVVGPPAIGLAYLMARRAFPGRDALAAVLGLPLVLPPTAIGLLLLRLFGSDGPLGRDTLGLDLGFLLSWKGAVAACSVMALPLVVRTARVTFEGVDPRLESMARTLGHGPLQTFARFTLPLAARGLIAAAILGFTRAVGEFGATVMVAGNIPGRTRTLASGIYAAQQAGREREATVLVLIAIAVGLVAVFASERLARSPAGATGGEPVRRVRRGRTAASDDRGARRSSGRR